MGRIVVNLEPGTGPAARRPKARRWLRILAVLAVVLVLVVVVIAVAGFFSWRRFQSSPEYSLTLLVDAAQRNDTAELAKRLDDDEIAKNMLASVGQTAIEQYDATRQQVDTFTPSMLTRLKPWIHEQVTTQLKSLAGASEPKPFVVLLATVPSLVTLTTEGDTAKASVKNRKIELTMRRDGERWKLVEFKDDSVVPLTLKTFMMDLPPPSGPFDPNDPLFKNRGRSRKKRR